MSIIYVMMEDQLKVLRDDFTDKKLRIMSDNRPKKLILLFYYRLNCYFYVILLIFAW